MRKAHLVLFLVVFVDLLGLGILAPLIPFYVERLGTSADIITLVIAVYSLSQFIGTPFWGGISDRIGRRPVLMISMAGHATAYLLLAYADTLALLILSRVVGGFTSANLATAYAYIADTTSNNDRAKNLGRISAAFGMGFIFGPVIGGGLASIGAGPDGANFVLPALAAMSLSLISCLGIFLYIPESAPKADKRVSAGKPNLIRSFSTILNRPIISMMTLLCFITILFVAGREAIFPLWADAKHNLSIKEVGIIISCGALTLTIFQLTLIGKFTQRFGETKLIRAALVLFALSWFGLTQATGMMQIILVTIIGSVGLAMFQTSMQSMLSKIARPTERGSVMSAYQATSSLGRFSGQAVSGSIYTYIGRDALFTAGAILMIPALILAFAISKAYKNIAPENANVDDFVFQDTELPKS